MKRLSFHPKFNFIIKLGVILGVLLSLNDVLTNFIFKYKSEPMGGSILESTQVIFFDFGIAALVVLVLLLPYFLLSKLHIYVANAFAIILAAIVLMANLLLNKYYATTNLSLGSDLYGYSLSDIQMIINTSADFSIKSNLSFLILPLFFFLIYFFSKKEFGKSEYNIVPLFAGLCVFCASVFMGNGSLTNLTYFINESISYRSDTLTAKGEWVEDNKFPLLHKNSLENDVLGENLNLNLNVKPNIVLIVVEGLGSDFMGKNAQYGGFTPYLDSLSKQSLYWSNFLSNTGRSFGALPSILGSLPFGDKGFLDLEDLPDHMSLLSILKNNNYQTSYFEGGDSDFDNKIRYLNREGIDYMLDQNNFGPGYTKAQGEAGFSWGYPDSEIFRKTLTLMVPTEKPRFDMIMTISNHEPFSFPDKEKYLGQTNKIADALNYSNSDKETVSEYKEVFASLIYTDRSIQSFMEAYKSNPNYANTIFIITGDHRLIPVPQKDALTRYHVPLLVYSPMLKAPKEFKGISSHFDVTPSLVSLLKKNYAAPIAETLPWLGKGLSSSETFEGDRQIPLMQYKGGFKDFVSGKSYLSNNELYKVSDNLSISADGDKNQLSTLKEQYNRQKKINGYVTHNNKIIPQNMVINHVKEVKFTAEQKEIIDENLKGMNPTEMFFKARDMAHNKQYEVAHLLCDYIISKNPNQFDARILKGRMYGWEKDKVNAERELTYVIERSPLYEDAYSAILDLYWWNDEYRKAVEISKVALKNVPNNKKFQQLVATDMGRFKKYVIEKDTEVAGSEALVVNK
jgi:lipoteichoic acid synthase